MLLITHLLGAKQTPEICDIPDLYPSASNSFPRTSPASFTKFWYQGLISSSAPSLKAASTIKFLVVPPGVALPPKILLPAPQIVMHAQEGRAVRVDVAPDRGALGHRGVDAVRQPRQAPPWHPRQVDQRLAQPVGVVPAVVARGPGVAPGGVAAEPERVEGRRAAAAGVGAVRRRVRFVLHGAEPQAREDDARTVGRAVRRRVRFVLHGAEPQAREDDARTVGRSPRRISLLRPPVDVVQHGDRAAGGRDERRSPLRPDLGEVGLVRVRPVEHDKFVRIDERDPPPPVPLVVLCALLHEMALPREVTQRTPSARTDGVAFHPLDLTRGQVVRLVLPERDAHVAPRPPVEDPPRRVSSARVDGHHEVQERERVVVVRQPLREAVVVVPDEETDGDPFGTGATAGHRSDARARPPPPAPRRRGAGSGSERRTGRRGGRVPIGGRALGQDRRIMGAEQQRGDD
eukprot:CAMPEP_0194298970 /NCGR_PEP_ID=MMETSP0169-20130528/60464_1 /TAXON_ID=218684 /ORGANISM="Corethron pennatum, Strain L29A3" /LENGTH=459 /DNA_ID=CAMNT_0039049023 /DNA_START=451 /DNA_END=1829 /DNA_ORIENTATION=-